jgi:hypothetical protein
MSSGIPTVGEFAEFLFDYCIAFSGSVTSWVRTVTRNRAVGGVVKSAHLIGVAADVVYDGARPGPEADTWLAARGLKRLPEGDHDHVMPLDWRL